MSVTGTTGALIGCRRPSRFWGLGCPKIYHEVEDSLVGHLFGDEVLILLARLLTDTFRDGDLLFRYGGEEFVVILKVFSQKDAVSVLERCLRTVGSHEMPQAGRVTISIGAVEIRDQNGTAEVIGSADRALYYAKNNGRNQLHIYEDLVEKNLLENAGQPQIGEIDLF
ncbi:MAG: GGDEF domain-containing protein [Gammaproteobacteria bacterium]|nr:GGDEF domain-containing protein [Gammaproteobacteria bacterium]